MKQSPLKPPPAAAAVSPSTPSTSISRLRRDEEAERAQRQQRRAAATGSGAVDISTGGGSFRRTCARVACGFDCGCLSRPFDPRPHGISICKLHTGMVKAARDALPTFALLLSANAAMLVRNGASVDVDAGVDILHHTTGAHRIVSSSSTLAHTYTRPRVCL